MAGYNELRGLRVKYLSADPANPEDGQVWYNSTTGNLRVQGIGVGAWSSSAPLSTGRNVADAFGTLSAGVYVGGQPSSPFYNLVEEYNGTGWSSGTNYPQNKTAGGAAGTLTAGLVAGGNTPPFTTTANQYDGSTWTATGSLPTAADNIGSCGTETQSNVIMALGRIPSTGNGGNNTTAIYNGSTFSAGPNINTGRLFGPGGGSGTGTAGLIFGGFIDPTPNSMTNTEEYDGSSWTVGGSLNNSSGLNTGWGIQTNTIAQSDASTRTATEQYNGTSWTSLPNLANTSGGYANSAGATGNAGWITALSPTLNKTEEWNFSLTTITPAAWSSGGALPKEQGQGGGCGTQNAGLTCGGLTPASPPLSELTDTFEYDGSAWSSGGSLPFARRNNSTFGIQTSALTVGDLNPVSNATDIYNGSTWTSGTNYPASVSNTGAAGTTAAGLIWGADQDPGFLSTTNEYNGSWTAGGALPAAKSNVACAGTQTAGLSVGGYEGPSSPTATVVNTSIEYDGSTWTSGGTDVIARYNAGGAGIQTSALIFGGNTPSNIAQATLYDGTSFATQPSLGTARFFQTQGLGATSSAALGAGGQSTVRVSITEEFTGGSPITPTGAQASTLTTS